LLRLLLPLEWQFNPAFVPTAMVGALVFHLVSNTCEELAWRGYAFDGLLRCFGHWPAQALIALVGALFHVMCGWSWQVALVSTTAGSLLFGLVFVRWRSVPAAIGVHSAWNWTRDLVMSPGTAAAVLEVQGPQRWGVAQWQIAQGVYVGVTLAACAALLLKLCARRAAYREPR
jgi:membrane protease YdiL (CAAX protease family)